MTLLSFAYGSNMHRAVMRKYAPDAIALGVACLKDYRFIITSDGYASVTPQPRGYVHGLLWRLTARDRIALDRWENIAAGLYAAARECGLPADYVASLQRWLPRQALNAGHRSLGEFA